MSCTVHVSQVRRIFVKFWVKLVLHYREYLNTTSASPGSAAAAADAADHKHNKIDGRPKELFRTADFLKSCDEETRVCPYLSCPVVFPPPYLFSTLCSVS
jgi:hypothetical protein